MIHIDPGPPMVVGEGVTTGHRAIIHGCNIDDGTLVGMGVIILNGAQIGRERLIGAEALITVGKEIFDGSLVGGAPSEVVRELDASAREAHAASAENYVQNWQRFAGGLRLAA